MSRKPTSKRTRPKPNVVIRLPDLDQAKSAVLNSSLSVSDLTLDFCGGGALRCQVTTHLGSSGLGSLKLI